VSDLDKEDIEEAFELMKRGEYGGYVYKGECEHNQASIMLKGLSDPWEEAAVCGECLAKAINEVVQHGS